MAGSIAERIEALVKEPVESLGLSLWDVKYVKEGASWYLRVFIDKEGGIDINDCVDASRLIDPILDEHDIISTSYCFEVCSPGIERELTKPRHYEAYKNAQVNVILIRPRNNVKEFIGRLKSAEQGNVTIETADGELIFNKQEIAKVKLSDI